MATNLNRFTDILGDTEQIDDSQPMSLSNDSDFLSLNLELESKVQNSFNLKPATITEECNTTSYIRPAKYTGQRGENRSVEEIDEKYQSVFTYPLFNLVQSKVIDDALYSDKSMVVCAPTGSGKTVVFEMAIVQLLKELDDKNNKDDFKIIYMAPVKSLCTERLTEWYPKFTPLGLNCVEVTGDTDVDFPQLKAYRIIITTPEKWDILTRRWRDHRGLVEVIKLFLIDEVHILNDRMRGPVLEAVVSRMKTIESSSQSAYRIEQLQQQYQEGAAVTHSGGPPRIRFVAVSATVNNPEDVAAWLGTSDRAAVFYKFGDECRPVKLKRVVEGYPCPEGTSIFKFDIILNYKLWPVIQKYHNGKPTLIFCNTRKSVTLTAEALSREITITFTPEQKAKLTEVASKIKNKKLQQLILNGVGCHHAGLLYEERLYVERAFRNRDLPILITTTTLAMGVNLPAHLVIIKNTQQYVNGAYQEYSISTVLQMVGRAGRPQFDTEATAVIMTRLADKPRYQLLVGGSEPLQSYLHKRLPENLNSEVALGTVSDVAQCVQWLRSTFLYIRAAKDPKWYLGLPLNAPSHHILKKIEELCVKAMNRLASSGLITMDEASCIESTEAGRMMSLYYLDLETMKHIMKIQGTETLDQILWVVCESHEMADMHLRMDERRCLNALNRNNQAATIRFPMKGKINSREMKLNCLIQAVLGCLPITEPSLNQEALKVKRIAERVCKCLVAYVTRPELINRQSKFYAATMNSIALAKCLEAGLWENSPYVSKQLKGIGPTFSTLLATAGKVNFLLLEESHPRDLERIMNKSAPAGNLLRKQISLLPKYQITATPMDEKRVSIQLTLLNQAYLAENVEHLTAGANHKSFIIIGDSENHLLLLSSFKDKDLISVYDGIITHEITRKHSLEHKIIAHCVSSGFVGIDVQCEYVFKSLEPTYYRAEGSTPKLIPVVSVMLSDRAKHKQTFITDVYNERKRKMNEDLTQSKEKKKRESALMSQLKSLKNSLDVACKEAKQSVVKDSEMPIDMSQSGIKEYSSANFQNSSVIRSIDTPLGESEILNEYEHPDMIVDDSIDNDMADEQIDSILNEIENEISNHHGLAKMQNNSSYLKNKNFQSSYVPSTQTVTSFKSRHYEKRQPIKPKIKVADNFEDNLDCSRVSNNHNSFSETIKSKIEKFLEKTRDICNNNKRSDVTTFINNTLQDNQCESPNGEKINNLELAENTNVIESHISNNTDNNFYTDNEHITDTARGFNEKEHVVNDENYSMIPEKDHPGIVEFAVSTVSTNSQDNCNQNTEEHFLDQLNSKTFGKKQIVKYCSEGVVEDKDCSETELPSIDLTIRLSQQNDTSVIDLTSYNKIQRDIFLPNPSSMTSTVNKNDYFDNKRKQKDFDSKTPVAHQNKHTSSATHPEEAHSEVSSIVSVQRDIILPKFQMVDNMPNCTRAYQFHKGEDHYIVEPHKSKKFYFSSLQDVSTINQVHQILPKRNLLNEQTNNFIDDITAMQPWYNLNTTDSILKLRLNSNDSLRNNQHVNYYTLNKNNLRESPKPNIQSLYSPITSSIPNTHESLSCIENNSKNDEYVNKYSLSATKVDVKNKTNSDHNIKIIRKVTLEVDVTEIISKSEKNNKTSDGKSNPESFDLHINENREYNKKITSTNQVMREPDKERGFVIQEVKSNNETSLIENVEPKEFCIINTAEEKIFEESNDDRQNKCNEENLIKDKTSNNTNNEVLNILNKYSKILKKKTEPERTIVNKNFKTKWANANYSKSAIKHKTDIKKINPNPVKKDIEINKAHRIHKVDESNVTLSRVIVEVSKKSTPTEILSNAAILSRIKALDSTTNEENKLATSKCHYLSTDESTEEDIQESEQIDYPSPTLSLATQDAPLNEIDQSMFNPKTVLQCFSRESLEFIPPPPEFCDEPSYSPTQNVFGGFESSSPENKGENYRYYQNKSPLNCSIFSEDCNTNLLTPSIEIETWTLSKNDEFENSFQLKKNALKSCTVMRKKSPVTTKSTNNTYLDPANNKLRNFKFMPKNKLRF